MSLIVSDEKLNLRGKSLGSLENWVLEKLKEIKQKKEVVFQKPYSHDSQGGGLTAPPTSFPLEAVFQDPETGLEQKWMLSTKTPKEIGNKTVYIPNFIRPKNDIRVDTKTDPELAFFLYYIMPEQVGRMGFVLKDFEKDADEENKKAGMEAHVVYLITTDLNDDDIRLRAYAWGVNKVEEKPISLLKKELRGKVNAAQALKEKNHGVGRGYEEFIAEAKENSETLLLTAYVTKAFNDDIITFERNKLKVSYKGQGLDLCRVPANRVNDYVSHVVQHLLSNATDRETFDAYTYGQMDGIGESAADYKTITNNAKLRSLAKSKYNVDLGNAKSNEEIIAKIEESLKG